MKTPYALAALIVGAGPYLAIHAAPVSHVCPTSIPETSIHVIAPGQEWKPFVASPMYLSGAAPADGPPELKGVLRERHAATTKAGTVQTYSLNGPYPDGKWLRCDYGAYGEMSLATRLPDDTRECTITRQKGEHAGEHRVAVQCR